MRQTAWLQASLKPPEGKTKLSQQAATKTMTRLQKLQDQGQPLPLPPAGLASHLVDYLFEVGPVAHGGMGPVPISHGEIAHWQANTGVALTAWEARGLRRLSQEYLAAMQAGEDPECPPPWVDNSAQERRQLVSDRVRALFGSRAKAQPRPH